MKKIMTIAAAAILLFSCAKIPVQSVDLVNALQAEGERMHTLNRQFLSQIFVAKRADIERFIRQEYTPTVLSGMLAGVNEAEFKAKFREELPDFVSAAIPVINRRRDSLVNAIELQKEKVVDKLTADFNEFTKAAFALKALLASAVKVDNERQALLDRARTLSNNQVDFNKIAVALDRFILSAGKGGATVEELNTAIDQLLKK